MILLRIADYIQIQKNRAPEILLKVRRLNNPISLREWEKHQSIEFINTNTSDPELIHVFAKPNNSTIYIELNNLFRSIQYELDISWAVLGEVYGRDETYKNLKIRYRRIKSNLENKQTFTKEVNYIPELVKFDADPEILKLLVGPLYGEDPKFGVREILQNSVDAVNERQMLIEKQFEKGSLEYQAYVPKIKIKLEFIPNDDVQSIEKASGLKLIIIDNGIGMSADSVVNYFLKAGASLRKSFAWRKNFVLEKDSMVLRTGRFGIGIFASFLLGDEIEVKTKSIESNQPGLYFTTKLSTNQIELTKLDCEIGTRISIKLSDKLFDEIKNKYIDKSKDIVAYPRFIGFDWFNWYKLTKPLIEYEIPSELKSIFNFSKTIQIRPYLDDVDNIRWRTFTPKGFTKVFWSFDFRYESWNEKTDNPFLVCNGFDIPGGYEFETQPEVDGEAKKNDI